MHRFKMKMQNQLLFSLIEPVVVLLSLLVCLYASLVLGVAAVAGAIEDDIRLAGENCRIEVLSIGAEAGTSLSKINLFVHCRVALFCFDCFRITSRLKGTFKQFKAFLRSYDVEGVRLVVSSELS